MLDWYVTCFPNLNCFRLARNVTCISVYVSTLQYYVFGVRLSGAVNIKICHAVDLCEHHMTNKMLLEHLFPRM
jgi:hypothetical protein